MKCVLIVLVMVEIDTSHQQTIPPDHNRCYCNALQTQDIMENAMPEIRRILQADSDKLTRQHEEVMAALKAIPHTHGSDERRILLIDPQYIQRELTRFQSELQEMQVKYNALTTLETKYADQITSLTDLQSKYAAQNTTLAEVQDRYDAQNADLMALHTKYNTQNTKLMDLQNKYNTQNTKLVELQGDKGAVFTRWGRSDCPANITTTVYSGFSGGSDYTNTGAAAEYVCMPNDPIWGPHKDLMHTGNVGYIFGADYAKPLDMFGVPNYLENIACAVCLGTQHTTSLMIPGRTHCYPGWTDVYHGDLASGYHGHAAASQYVCIDENEHANPRGGTHNEGGKLLYGVTAKCGSLPCPPYEDGKFLSCVVCMK